jgi:GNAT superfamily N-acetyltransferase
MTVMIRRLRAEDYEPAVALYRLIDPAHAEDAAMWQRADEEAEASAAPRRWVTADETTGEIVAYAAHWRVRQQKFRMDLLVHPARRRRGIGRTLYDTIINDLRATPAETLQARAWDDWVESLAFLARRAFAEVHRMYELRLDLRAADLKPFAKLPARLSAEGISFSTLPAEEATDEMRCWARLTDLQNAAAVDWPDPDPGGPFTRDHGLRPPLAHRRAHDPRGRAHRQRRRSIRGL